MKFSIADTTTFLDSLRAIGTLINEAAFKADEHGLSLIAMDAANVAMVIFKMGPSEFMEWNVPEPTTFVVKVADLKNVVSRAPKAQLTISLESNQLFVLLNDKGKHKEFKIGLLSEDEKPKTEPALQFKAVVNMDNAELKDAIADATLIGESCQFNVIGGKMLIKASGDGSARASESDVVATVTGVDCKSKYSIEYLDKMLSTKISKNIRVQLGTDYPIKLSFTNATGTAGISFILAPRIENS